MKTKDLITYGLIAGGAYALYWYITNYGPTGRVTDANGNKVAASYWDTWFGSSAAAASAPAPAPAAGVAAGIAAGASAAAPASAPTPDATGQALLTAAGIPASTKFTVSQWNYYYGKWSGVQQDAVNLGDNGQPMLVTDYLSLRASKGYTTPQSGNSTGQGTGSGVTTTSTSAARATADQVSQITALLKASDVAQFQQMVANGLTSDQAAAMLSNAQACMAQNAALVQARNLLPVRTPIPVMGFDLAANGCAPTGGMQGLGVLTPAQAVRSSTASPVPASAAPAPASPTSPWGRLAAVDAGMNWKN